MTFFRQNAFLLLLLLIILVGSLWLYIPTAAHGLIYGGGVESESAQLQRVANRLGIAHSTGYPLWTLIGYGAARLADALDANPYTAITYTSTLAVALGLMGVFLAGRLVGSTASALGAVALLATTSTVWHIATITETQALHFACMAAIWWGIVAHTDRPDRAWPLLIMAGAAGVGLANHRTILFSIGAAGLVVLVGGTWRRWPLRRWALLIALVGLPLLSYGYLFIRVQDPHVVYSTRPTWFPAQIDNGVIVDLIRGTLQSGEGLEGNLVLPRDDAPARLDFVRDNLQADLSALGLVAGVAGWGLIGSRRPRVLLAAVFFAGAWVIFLMSWRLDWKAVIYQHALLMLAAFGWAGLLAAPRYLPDKRRPRWVAHPAVLVALSLPLFVAARGFYLDNYAARDLSADNRGDALYSAFAALPPDAVVQTGGWSPDAFILLEYLDSSGRTDVLPVGAESAEQVAARAQSEVRPVILGPFLRGIFGLYSGSLYFQARGLSFSGTLAPELFALRPADDLRLLEEAAAATVIEAPIAPEVSLYSYTIIPQAERYVVVLYWRAARVPMPSYSVFTHLRAYGTACDAASLQRLISQDDSSGTVRNIHPTTVWQADELVKDTYFVPRPDAVPAGAALVVGMTLDGVRVGEWCVPAP